MVFPIKVYNSNFTVFGLTALTLTSLVILTSNEVLRDAAGDAMREVVGVLNAELVAEDLAFSKSAKKK
ncbi:hypothetical protein CONCODRAFT_96217 [Conidiobolus coronatus NRRL 28638]|uniref:Uncharacterized protein n=1 Tax=Conidiobolus coronatus (strain ATCC 28846 / CBS 209.66 / NRRL 28638) TaxID=796925 RepID=A0A137PG27_CONC2|nr:hypothetical protein CONCODRAFT_96217 [Conidiobolus coronatus NRRL 28638]|eukprot:KXN73956.1 hypothetical protein CONCODRAFT_96217 [Conidiobolus coronatus NRRL 28638]